MSCASCGFENGCMCLRTGAQLGFLDGLVPPVHSEQVQGELPKLRLKHNSLVHYKSACESQLTHKEWAHKT